MYNVIIWYVAVQSLSHVRLFVTPWTATPQVYLSFTISQSFLRFTSIELVMLSNHLTFCCPLLLPSIFPSIRVFFYESALCIRRPKYWSFSFSISPSTEYLGLIFRLHWFDRLAILWQIWYSCTLWKGFLGDASGKEPTCQCRRLKRSRFDLWVGKIPWRRTQQPTPVFLPRESHEQRIKSIMLQRLGHHWSNLTYTHTHTHTHTHTL